MYLFCIMMDAGMQSDWCVEYITESFDLIHIMFTFAYFISTNLISYSHPFLDAMDLIRYISTLKDHGRTESAPSSS